MKGLQPRKRPRAVTSRSTERKWPCLQHVKHENTVIWVSHSDAVEY